MRTIHLFAVTLLLSSAISATVRPDELVGEVHNPRMPFAPQRLGTAWCLNDQCDLMVTNYHVISFIGKKAVVNGVRVTNAWSATGPDDVGARVMPGFAESFRFNIVRDLAILRMKAPLAAKGMRRVPFFSSELHVNEPVTVYSYPAGRLTVTNGKFVALVEEGVLKFALESPLTAGSSGGLIINANGEAVGVLFALDPTRRSAFAIPMWSLAAFVKTVQPGEYREIFPVDPYRPRIRGRLLMPATPTRQETEPMADSDPASQVHSGSSIPAPIGSMNPSPILPEGMIHSALTTAAPERREARGRLTIRPEDPSEVQTLRSRAQAMVNQMKNFIAIQTLTLPGNAVWQHQVKVVDGQQLFIRSDSTELTELPIPRLGTVPGSEWRDLPQMVGSNLRLPIRYIGERYLAGANLRVFQFSAAKEDSVCRIRVKRGWLRRLWMGSTACYGEVWTDGNFNILRITEIMNLPRTTGVQQTSISILYGWLHSDGATAHLVPTSMWLQTLTTQGVALDSSATFSGYRVFTASARILP